jgi:hypothetical protein
MSNLISNILGAIGGTAATAVGDVAAGPVSAVGSIASLINGVVDRVCPDPAMAAQMKLATAQLDQQGHFKEIDAKVEEEKTDASVIVAQQAAIAADASGRGGWLQNNWHAIGSLFAIGLVSAIYFFLPLIGRSVPEVPESAWMMMLAVLGVAAWHSGQATTQAVKNAAPPA